LVLPLIALDKPRIYAAETADGSSNFRLTLRESGGSSPTIGDLSITGGDARIVIPQLKTDFQATIATQDEGEAAKPGESGERLGDEQLDEKVIVPAGCLAALTD
jgi:hypothetical protein